MPIKMACSPGEYQSLSRLQRKKASREREKCYRKTTWRLHETVLKWLFNSSCPKTKAFLMWLLALFPWYQSGYPLTPQLRTW